MSFTARLFVAVLVVFSVMAVAGCDRSAQGNYPSKQIEMVVQAGAGGGSDIFMRTIADVIDKNKLMPVTISVVNKPGGSSAVAKAYVAEHPGDPHFWLSTTSSFTTSYVLGQSDLSYKDFTPLGLLVRDSQVVFTRAESPFNSMKELVDVAKKDPGKVNWAGTNVGSSEHILAFRVGESTGAKFNYVAFEGGGEINSAILGGHVDVATANPQEVFGLLEGKKIKVLGSTAEKRIPNMPDVQTFKEQGIDVVAMTIRGLQGPKDLPKEAVTYIENVLKKVVATPEWEKYSKDNDLLPSYMTSAEFGKLMAEELTFYDTIMGELGLKK